MTQYQKVIITLVAFAFFIEGLDANILNTSLPQIALSLKVSPLELKTVLTSYLITTGIFIPISGWFADKFGVKSVFSISTSLFLLGSVVCGLSDNLTVMIIGRVIQGLGGAFLLPIGRLLLIRSFLKEEFVYAMSIATTFGIVGPSLGPLLGGVITTLINWRFIFFINVPIGMLALFFIFRDIKNEKAVKTVRPFDLIGFVLLAVSVVSLLFALEKTIAASLNWHEIIFAVICSLMGFILYYFYAHIAPAPIIDLQIFNNPGFLNPLWASIFARMALAALPFLSPLLLQIAWGMSSLQSGLYSSIGALSIILSKYFIRRLIKRCSVINILIINSFLLFLSLNLVILVCFFPLPLLIISVFIINGFLISLEFSTMNSLLYINLSKEFQGMGTSFISSFQQVTQSIGIALSAFILSLFVSSAKHLYSPKAFAFTFCFLSLLLLVSSLSFLKIKKLIKT